MSYHINPETGNPGKCSARIKCRFEGSEHYDSLDEARAAYEKQMALTPNSTTLDTYEKTLPAYKDGSPQTVSGAMKAFIDDSFSSLPRGSKVLELGAGFGRDAKYLSGAGYDVTATDAPDSFVEELRSQGLKARKLNVLTDGFPRTDAIFANAVFLHLDRDQMSQVLAKSHRALHGKGHLVFTVKEGSGEGWSNEKLDAPRHFTYWGEEELKAKVEAAGFVDVSITVDDSGPAKWLQVHARKPKSTNKTPNARETLAPRDEKQGVFDYGYNRGLSEKMIDAREGSTIEVEDGRRFTKTSVNLYGKNSWKYERDSYVPDSISRLEPGHSYNGALVSEIIGRMGGVLSE